METFGHDRHKSIESFTDDEILAESVERLVESLLMRRLEGDIANDVQQQSVINAISADVSDFNTPWIRAEGELWIRIDRSLSETAVAFARNAGKSSKQSATIDLTNEPNLVGLPAVFRYTQAEGVLISVTWDDPDRIRQLNADPDELVCILASNLAAREFAVTITQPSGEAEDLVSPNYEQGSNPRSISIDVIRTSRNLRK